MRTLAIALVLGLFAAGTASAAPRHKPRARHAKKSTHRATRHAKAKLKHSGARHAANDQLLKPEWA